MTGFDFRLKAISKAANTIITIPQVRFTLKSGAMSACAPGNATPYPVSSEPRRTNSAAMGFRRSSGMIQNTFRIYHKKWNSAR